MRFLPSKTDRKFFGQIANEYDLVYFGRVDPRVDEEYKEIRGLTASPMVHDENYTTGNVYDYEVIFLQRSKNIYLEHNVVAKRKWTILQVQLKKANMPHIFIDNRANGSPYGGLLMSALRLPEISWRNFSADDKFSKAFAVYAKPQSIQEVQDTLTPEVQTMLMTHFPTFDYEFQDDKLIIYTGNDKMSVQLLDRMLRVGLWLARDVDRCAGKICEIRDYSD
jgi:hypothetical protein